MMWLRHVWQASWAPCEEPGQRHISVLKIKHLLYIFGFHIPILDFDVKASQVSRTFVDEIVGHYRALSQILQYCITYYLF